MVTIPGRIPIRIYPFFWFMIAIIGWVSTNTVYGTLIWAVVIFFSVLIHEYGHALTALAFGQQAYIELVGLGGVTNRQGPKLELWKEFLIVINGPLAGFCLFLVAYMIYGHLGKNPTPTVFNSIIFVTMYANLIWTIMNLLPIHPLDGGRLFSIILESIFGLKGIKFSLIASSIFSLCISVFFFLIQALLAGSIFLLLAFESYSAWRGSLTISSKDQDDNLQLKLQQAEEDLRSNRYEEAKSRLEEIRDITQEGVLYNTATEYLANLLVNQGHPQEASVLLDSIRKSLSPEGLRLLHQLAYRSGDWKKAIELGNQAYQGFPSYEIALTNALCYASLNDPRPAVGWLQRAIGDGLPNPRVVLNKEEFDNIRSNALFQDLTTKLSRTSI